MEDLYRKAAEIIKESKYLIALTGAGISVESGIPDFRSAGGLWEKYTPAEYATIDAFRADPAKVWQMIFDMTHITQNAKPNPAHRALARLEEMNILKSIITQNIDNPVVPVQTLKQSLHTDDPHFFHQQILFSPGREKCGLIRNIPNNHVFTALKGEPML